MSLSPPQSSFQGGGSIERRHTTSKSLVGRPSGRGVTRRCYVRAIKCPVCCGLEPKRSGRNQGNRGPMNNLIQSNFWNPFVVVVVLAYPLSTHARIFFFLSSLRWNLFVFSLFQTFSFQKWNFRLVDRVQTPKINNPYFGPVLYGAQSSLWLSQPPKICAIKILQPLPVLFEIIYRNIELIISFYQSVSALYLSSVWWIAVEEGRQQPIKCHPEHMGALKTGIPITSHRSIRTISIYCSLLYMLL